MPDNDNIRSLSYMIDDVSTKLKKPLFREDNGSRLDIKKMEELKNHVFSFLTSQTALERRVSMEYLHKSLTELPILHLNLSKLNTEKAIVDVVEVFIGLPSYTNYLSYVGKLQCRYLNNNALQYLQVANDLPI